jgi:holo-[acyl-carrier protein] synthase
VIVGIGVDVVDLDRFAATLRRQPSIATRVFSEGERAYCDAAKAERVRVERYAARFAAKEAVSKALRCGLGSYPFTAVEVLRDDSGAPLVALHGAAAEKAATEGVDLWHLSITHDAAITIAFVVAESFPVT